MGTGGCTQQHKDGAFCRSPAMKGEEYCFFHHPDEEDRRVEARRRGGDAGRFNGLSEVSVQTSADLVNLLALTMNEVRTGAMPPAVANAVGYLASQMARLLPEQPVVREAALSLNIDRESLAKMVLKAIEEQKSEGQGSVK